MRMTKRRAIYLVVALSLVTTAVLFTNMARWGKSKGAPERQGLTLITDLSSSNPQLAQIPIAYVEAARKKQLSKGDATPTETVPLIPILDFYITRTGFVPDAVSSPIPPEGSFVLRIRALVPRGTPALNFCFREASAPPCEPLYFTTAGFDGYGAPISDEQDLRSHYKEVSFPTIRPGGSYKVTVDVPGYFRRDYEFSVAEMDFAPRVEMSGAVGLYSSYYYYDYDSFGMVVSNAQRDMTACVEYVWTDEPRRTPSTREDSHCRDGGEGAFVPMDTSLWKPRFDCDESSPTCLGTFTFPHSGLFQIRGSFFVPAQYVFYFKNTVNGQIYKTARSFAISCLRNLGDTSGNSIYVWDGEKCISAL